RPSNPDGRGRGGPRRTGCRGRLRSLVLPRLISLLPRGFPGPGRPPRGGRMNTFGTRYRPTVFGTSHGPFVGCTTEGLAAGTPVDERFVQGQLDRGDRARASSSPSGR